MHWFYRIALSGNTFLKLAAPGKLNISTSTFVGGDGKNYVALTGSGTYMARDQLRNLGFLWNNPKKHWFADVTRLQQNPASLSALSRLGVDCSVISPGYQAQPVAPQQPAQPQQPANWYKKDVKPQVSSTATPGKLWYLARTTGAKLTEDTMLSRTPAGQFVAVSRSPQAGSWDWMNSLGDSGVVPEADIRLLVKTVMFNDNGKTRTVTSEDPVQLIQDGDPAIPKPESANTEAGIKGRIPPEKISPYQKAAETTFTTTDKGIVMNALAGSGKTSTLKHLASFKKPNEKWLYLVFNKKNQVESAAAFPAGVEVLTSHSFLGKVLGNSAQLGLVEGTDLWPRHKGERISAILDARMEGDETFPYKLRFAAKRIIKQLASLGKAFAIDPKTPDAPQKIQDIIRQYQIDTDLSTPNTPSNADYTQDLIEKTLDTMWFCMPGQSGGEFEGQRDHDDTLWYAAMMANQIKWPKYDVVLADEVQDFNRCQMLMLQKLREAGARIVAVGDPAQSCYMFRGADAKAFDNIQSMITADGGVNHELPVNYRSGKKIIEYVNQNTKVNNLQAGVNKEGLVTEGRDYDQSMAELSQEWQKGGNKLTQQTAMIARTNKPLVDAAIQLLKTDIDFAIIGRDFSKELIDYVEKVAGKGRYANNYPIDKLSNELQGHYNNTESKWRGKLNKTPALQEMKDTNDSLQHVIMHLASTNYSDQKLGINVTDTVTFLDYLRKKFGGVDVDTAEGAQQYRQRDPRSFVTLTTGHRSKGMEYKRVFLLRRDLYPHPKAKSPEAIDQEENVLYVSLTRAEDELHVLHHKNPT